ncbi:ABC transporter ATP-binding protein [Halospeciosus flavus]|uniref:ABC transporter ATP-binding protein n=1 Tax=Halospeciosus flavus TaxID=3032283 RepID=A0ABD5Z4I8_9EURY|nr:oligopeptide/dipeptide ABC transporter ATP-binding protein [Halospeciosus flavus]
MSRAASTPETESSDGPLLAVEGLQKHFDRADGFLDKLVGEGGKIRAVDGVDFSLDRGETLAVVGESGCGKSTLGRTVLNLDTPTGGTVRFAGDEISDLSGKDLKQYRRRAQMVFQDPLASLNPRKTVGEILTAPMEVHGIGDSKADRRERAKELLERVGLKPGHYDRYPRQFSGGQQQRVGIARALAVEPDLIVADEPVSALDVSVQAQILQLLEDLQEEYDLALLFISHDLSVVRQVADRVAVMYLGELVETAPVDTLFAEPSHPYTESLLSAVPRIDPEHRTDRIVLEGTVPSPADPPSGCRFHTRCPKVIPPEDSSADQSAFRAAFSFRNRILSEDLDVEAIRTRLDSEGRATDEAAVADYVVETMLEADPDSLPGEAADAVREAADAIASENHDLAERVVREAFPSPCEREVPDDTRVGEQHVASCHRIGDGD